MVVDIIDYEVSVSVDTVSPLCIDYVLCLHRWKEEQVSLRGVNLEASTT